MGDHLHHLCCGRIRTSTISYKINSFLLQCKGSNIRCKDFFPRKRRISLVLRMGCITEVLFLPITVTLQVTICYGACLFLMQMSFTDRALLNQSLFRQIHERKFYIILSKFSSIKHKACHWITKALSCRPLPIRAPAHRAA